ncbi:GTP-binding protein Di-Ras2 [Hylaeus anthracinus]|uniref:GTP-binding protein Di-Ras2 n=1 Tax=Hylaeus volcanicus TaxID=313075 RepID=UPI0023B83987|nr:GTP-binding protein Di-Ras2 [Hylaeus volcanicus]XP_053973266.1 GTP-binding protein Di-Ras2 [Hylaeus volcanicus]XP_053996453.1 GTP-binding protein Di-Ras2 [Hylaeus anthracinus]XP_053996454.1 GTP-binding protein Di-Ras2 [Hylaeus anthracinus]
MADLERIRLVVLGGAGVGKSAIIRRLLGQGFNERYRPTVEDLYSRECVLGTLTLKVDLLDTAGDLQFPAMRRLSIATAHAFLLVYATTSLPSFECVKQCFEEVREQRPDFQEVPIVIAGNKLDLAPTRREVAIEDVSEWVFCKLPKLRAKVMECSAKDDYNIKDVFRCFVALSRIVQKNNAGESDESGLRRRCSAYGSRRSGSPHGRTGSAGGHGGNSQQTVAAQGSNVVAVTEETKSKPRSRSLIRRASRKTKQQIRDAHTDDCNIS